MRVFSILLCLGLMLLAPSLRADTGVILYSQPGDYIGGGGGQQQSGTVTASGSSTHLAFNFLGFSADFSAPSGENLVTGSSFSGATRYPFNSSTRPGISISGNGRGCNTVKGWFEVKEALYDGSGQPARIAIDFRQNCEGGTPALIGAIRYNSNLPTELPAVVAIAGPKQFVMGKETVVLNGVSSFIGTTDTTPSYEWQQLSGTPVSLNGASTQLVDFVAPLVPPGGENLVFQLSVNSGPGTATDTDTVTIKVGSKADPQTYIQFNSDAGDYIGDGKTVRYTLLDGSFSASKNYRGGISVGLSGDSWWTLAFGPPQGVPFAAGTYTGAQRFAFAAAESPGMDIYGNGRGCNTLTGQFTVITALLTGSQVDSFAADFEQHCEGSTPALRGKVRWNYLEPGAPFANAGSDQAVFSGTPVTLDGSSSSDDHGLVFHRWRQLAGPAVSLLNDTTASASFVAPTVSADTILQFQLLVADEGELTAADVVDITVKPLPVSVDEPGDGGSGTGGSGDDGDGGAVGGSGGSLDLFSLMLMVLIGPWLRRRPGP